GCGVEVPTMSEYRFRLRGEVDIATAPRVRADFHALIAHDSSNLLIDCSQLDFIDSTGIVVLLEANRDLEADGRHMLLVNVPEGPRRVFEILALTNLFCSDRELVS